MKRAEAARDRYVCPVCHAAAGQRCKRTTGNAGVFGRRMEGLHSRRLNLVQPSDVDGRPGGPAVTPRTRG